jgi:histidinol-phosphate aminotransferase
MEIVEKALINLDFVKNSIANINQAKNDLIEELKKIKQVKSINVSHANFLLVNFESASALFEYLIEQKVITRNRSNVPLCEDSIRITIGLSTENSTLIDKIKSFYL